MGDSNFHIVQKSDGQFKIVKLAPILKKIVNPKIVDSPRGDCKNEANSKVENEVPVAKKIEESEYPRSLRTYSRIRKEQIRDPAGNVTNPRFVIHKEKVFTITTPTTDVSSIKIWPAIDNRREAEKDKLVQRSQPSGEHRVIGNKSIKVYQKVSSATAGDSDSTTLIANENNALLKLAQQYVKCNICGMAFAKAHDQLITLKNHFLQHKTSVLKVVRKSKRYRLDKFNDKCTDPIKSPVKKPVILNNTIRCWNTELMKNAVKTCRPQPGGKNSENSRFRIAASQELVSIGANSVGTLKQRRLIKVKPISRHLLDKLRSLDQFNNEKYGKPKLVIGNTIIKPVKHRHADVTESSEAVSVDHMESIEGRRAYETMIADVDGDDDDVEIVEQNPELIVIDDNDEENNPS